VKAGKRTSPDAQKESWGYKVDDTGEHHHVSVVDAKWPPDGRLITGAGLWNDIIGEYLK
jgi:hypothetical protein